MRVPPFIHIYTIYIIEEFMGRPGLGFQASRPPGGASRVEAESSVFLPWAMRVTFSGAQNSLAMVVTIYIHLYVMAFFKYTLCTHFFRQENALSSSRCRHQHRHHRAAVDFADIALEEHSKCTSSISYETSVPSEPFTVFEKRNDDIR